MEFFAHHGCFEEEQITGTYFSVDVNIEARLDKAATSDDLNDTLNYQRVYDLVKAEMQIPSKLLEHVAGRILQSLHKESEMVDSATVTIRKLNPPLGGKVACAAVTISR